MILLLIPIIIIGYIYLERRRFNKEINQYIKVLENVKLVGAPAPRKKK